MEADMENLLLEEDYYQLLNIPRTATKDEITSAYRKYSRIFHPDKHSTDPTQQKWAEHVFNKIKEAYDVLSDSKKRAIYDTMGKHGLEVDGWQLIYRTRTPKEIRDEYERLKREREDKMLEQSTNPKTSITMAINASELFPTYTDEFEILEEASFPSIEISSMNIQQSISAPITLRDTATLSGGLSTQNGIGSGSINISNRHFSSEDLWTEYDFGIGNGPLIGIKLFKKISKMMFLNTAVTTHFAPRGTSPSFVSSLSMQMDSRSVGHLTYKIGMDGSTMSTTYIWGSENFHTSSAVVIGSPHSFISFNVMYKLPQYELRLKLALKYGTFGALVEYGVEKKLTKYSKISASVAVGIPTGVMVKLKWAYSSQTIVVPIHLCDEVMLSPVYYGTLVPLLSWLVLKSLVLDPITKERLEKQKQKIMEANFERIQELQKEARAVVELMRETCNRIKTDEEKNNGLVITHALYGKLPEGQTNHSIPEESGDTEPTTPKDVIDVTIPMQCFVKDSRLELLGSTKVDLPGFFDTHIGEKKHLTVQYLYRNNLHLCSVPDEGALILPRNGHRIKKRS